MYVQTRDPRGHPEWPQVLGVSFALTGWTVMLPVPRFRRA